MIGDDFMEIITTDLKERLDFWQMDIVADGMTTVAIMRLKSARRISGNGKLSELGRTQTGNGKSPAGNGKLGLSLCWVILDTFDIPYVVSSSGILCLIVEQKKKS